MGHVVFRYAEEIFTLGRELVDTVRGRPTDRPLRVLIGVTDVLPTMVVYRLLTPLLRLTPPVQIVCREGKLDGLLMDLGMYSLDVVLSDAPRRTDPSCRSGVCAGGILLPSTAGTCVYQLPSPLPSAHGLRCTTPRGPGWLESDRGWG